jgi:hypothetical protein
MAPPSFHVESNLPQNKSISAIQEIEIDKKAKTVFKKNPPNYQDTALRVCQLLDAGG